MSLDLYIEKLPVELQESFKQEIEKYIPVEGLEKHPVFQSKLSLKHEESMKKFQSEKMPGIIEEEIKKRSSKQPWEIEIENLRKENAEIQKQGVLKERKAQAMAKMAELGLSTDLADFVIDEDETVFSGKIEKLTGSIKTWRDAEIKKAGINAFGQKPPVSGQSGSVDFSKMSVTEVMQFAGQSPENANAVAQWQKTRK